MKTLLSLILPENSTFRYLKNGRKGIGFRDGTLITRDSNGVEVGITALAVADVTMAAGNAAVVSKRFTIFSGRTAATAATIPAASGPVRDLIIQNANTSSGAVTVTSPATNIYTAASASPTSTHVIPIATTHRFLSDGTSWFRTH
jgi:hypothetical protein